MTEALKAVDELVALEAYEVWDAGYLRSINFCVKTTGEWFSLLQDCAFIHPLCNVCQGILTYKIENYPVTYWGSCPNACDPKFYSFTTAMPPKFNKFKIYLQATTDALKLQLIEEEIISLINAYCTVKLP